MFDRRAEYRSPEGYDVAVFQRENSEFRLQLIEGGVSKRTANALARVATPIFPVTNPDILAKLEPDQIRSIDKIGDKSMSEIQTFLSSREEQPTIPDSISQNPLRRLSKYLGQRFQR